MECQKVFAKAKESSNDKGSGSSRSPSCLHISYWHAKVCTAVEHRQRHSWSLCDREKGTGLDMPENYEKLLKDEAYLEFALKRCEEREKELRELVEKESNEYKRNALKSELKVVENAKNLLVNLIQSLRSESRGCEGACGRNPKQVAWQVLKVALLFLILGKVLPRDLSPLKPVLVGGVWDRVRSRLVPLSAGGLSR
jgi:Hypothetical protein